MSRRATLNRVSSEYGVLAVYGFGSRADAGPRLLRGEAVSAQGSEVALLAGEKWLVTDPRLGDRFGEMAGYRNRLTHYSDLATSEELFEILRDRLGDVEPVADALRKTAARLARGK